MKVVKRNVEEGYGQLNVITTEKEILELSTSTKQCIVHFIHKDFKRCKVMSEKLQVSILNYSIFRPSFSLMLKKKVYMPSTSANEVLGN
jgi:hypothetical protein